MATIQSLVESRSFIIDRTDFITTGDKVFIDGHFYSDKPPMPSIIAAAVYLPLHAAGLRLHEGNSICYFLITLSTVTLLWLLGTLALFESLEFTRLDAERRLLAGIALGLGTIYMSWSTTFNNHELSAAFLSIGFCHVLKARFEPNTRRNLAVAGLCLSLAAACDNPTAVFYLLFLCVNLTDQRLRRATPWFVLPLLVSIVPVLAVNYSIHRSILPVQIYRTYFQYPGSPWLGSDALSGIRTNSLPAAARYAFLTLFGPRGFLLYNPLLLVAFWGLAKNLKRGGPFFREAVCVTAGSLLLAGYYWLGTNNFGDWSYSIRWFVPLLPPLMFFVFPFLAPADRRRSSVFQALLCVSVTIALVGALNPWSPMVYSDVPFVANLEQFAAHLRHPPLPER